MVLGNGNDHSRLTLFQGSTKYELDAKDCPVGVAFPHQEHFSCGCVNGIWAFYDNPCHPPSFIIGGDNHCFPMPSKAIRLVLIVSNPLKGLGESLTAFTGDMAGIRSKVYRNIHTRLDQPDKFISLNSSWTLSSPDGSKSICIESRSVVIEGMTSDEVTAYPGMTYCSFTGVGEEMPFIGSFKKGCESSMVLEPLECQPMLPSTDEGSICLNETVNAPSQNQTEVNQDLDPVSVNEINETGSLNNSRLSRTLNNLVGSAKEEKVVEQMKVSDTSPNFVRGYFGEPEWHKRWAESKGSKYFKEISNIRVSPGAREEKGMDIDSDKMWKDPNSFFSTTTVSKASNQLIANHLWTHHRFEIRNVLNMTKLVSPEEDNTSGVVEGKATKLLKLHADIMKKICPLIPQSFLDTVVGTFVSVLTKGLRWEEPLLEKIHYRRILTSLTECKNGAEMMKFENNDTNKCNLNLKAPSHITLRDTSGESTVNMRLDIPAVFQSEGFEPIIESVWKTFVTVHSYCYKDFSEQYQDHHSYTTLMFSLFTNKIHDLWVRNQTNSSEYGGVLGNLAETLKGLDSCATGARMTSHYPYHLNRPTKMSKYQDDDEIILINTKIRQTQSLMNGQPGPFRQLKSDAENNSKINPMPHRRKKRLAASGENLEKIVRKRIFNNKGICLRKYSESRSTIGKHCKRESTNKL